MLWKVYVLIVLPLISNREEFMVVEAHTFYMDIFNTCLTFS